MLSLVLSKYQDMMDAHAASSESGSSALVVEERRVFAKQISELKENAAFLTEQLTSTRVQLAAKEQQAIQLHTALQNANDARALSDSNCRALQLSQASFQSLLQSLQAENAELVQKNATLEASLKEQQRIAALRENPKEPVTQQHQTFKDQQHHRKEESQLKFQKQSAVQQQQQQHNDEFDLVKHQRGSLSQQDKAQRSGESNHASKGVGDRDSTAVADNRIDLPALEAKLKALSAGVYRDESNCSSASAAHSSSFPHKLDITFPAKHDFSSSFKHDSVSSFDKGTLLATMLLEQAREGRINVDTVHLQALRISLDGASPSLSEQSTANAILENRRSFELLESQKRLHEAVADLHEQQLQWQVCEAKLQQDLRVALADLAATKDALAVAESRALELIADFTERDVKNARDAEAQMQAVKRACDIRIQQVQAECAESARSAADAAALAISAVREECGIQLQSAKDSCFALEQRCATFSTHLIAEQRAATSARADHERAEASLRMECDQIDAALAASRFEVSKLVADVARMQTEVREREQALRDSQTDIVKMRDTMARAVEEKAAADKHAHFLQQQLHEATALAQKLGDAERKEMEAACVLNDMSLKMTGLEVRVQQLARELNASLGELAEARAASVSSQHGLDDIAHELMTVKDESLEEKKRFEGEIKHLKDHLKETAAGKVAAEDENVRLKKEIIELQLKIVELTEQITEQQKNAVAGAEETREIHLKALNFVKEQHNHQTQLLAEHHAQQKQFWLHSEQELREAALERKQAANAALASLAIQKKAAEALVEEKRRENTQLADQVRSRTTTCVHVFSFFLL